MRRWHRQWVSVGRPASTVVAPQPELPLPKDAHLLSATSQGLLAAARAGSSPDDVPKAREPQHAEPLFRIKRWVRIAKEDEPPEPVYLAKVPEPAGKRAGDATVANGTVDGGGISVGNTGSRRRVPPPPKKKNKRPGRKPGFKKSVSFAEGEQSADPAQGEQQKPIADADAMDVDVATTVEPVPQNAVTKEIEKAAAITEVATEVATVVATVVVTEVVTEVQKKDEGLHHSLPPKPNF